MLSRAQGVHRICSAHRCRDADVRLPMQAQAGRERPADEAGVVDPELYDSLVLELRRRGGLFDRMWRLQADQVRFPNEAEDAASEEAA